MPRVAEVLQTSRWRRRRRRGVVEEYRRRNEPHWEPPHTVSNTLTSLTSSCLIPPCFLPPSFLTCPTPPSYAAFTSLSPGPQFPLTSSLFLIVSHSHLLRPQLSFRSSLGGSFSFSPLVSSLTLPTFPSSPYLHTPSFSPSPPPLDYHDHQHAIICTQSSSYHGKFPRFRV